MGQDKINSNSKYQKEIERSFAVIYHNLKRIQDTEHAPLTRRYSQPETSSSAVSQQRRRRPGRDKTNSTVAQGSKSTRRVSFSVWYGTPSSRLPVNCYTDGLKLEVLRILHGRNWNSLLPNRLNLSKISLYSLFILWLRHTNPYGYSTEEESAVQWPIFGNYTILTSGCRYC